MDKIQEMAYEILDMSQEIYRINESTNPTAIFKNKIFLIGTEENREAVSVQIDYEKKDSSYYFKSPEIVGVIIKRENSNYCVKARVKYANANNQNLWFAKIRIETSYDGNVQIMGKWGGSWEDADIYDESLITNSELPFALDSMKAHLADIYNQLYENNGLNPDLYDPEWVKKLKNGIIKKLLYVFL